MESRQETKSLFDVAHRNILANDILTNEIATYSADLARQHGRELTRFIRYEDMVGDLFKIDYAECEVQVHDALRQQVGGIPLGCFLLATRLSPETSPDPREEDSSLILLRVVGQGRMPNQSEMDDLRFRAAQRASDTPDTWDAHGKTDQYTLHQLRYAVVKCRVLGTFRFKETQPGHWHLTFGADISNFYSGQGMKIYKPVGQSLATIVNFTRAPGDDAHPLTGQHVEIARVRYASSEREINASRENVVVQLDPTDLIARRTALFGMSRTGKSNTTKVVASSVFRLREINDTTGRVGQLIFDVNGEYANENTQDGNRRNPGCLKNIWQDTTNATDNDVITYGLTPHPNDPNRRIVKINFFGVNPPDWTNRDQVIQALAPLYVGKESIDAHLSREEVRYITSFRNTLLEPPQALDRGTSIRYRRQITVYRTALYAAGFEPPAALNRAHIHGLFNAELRGAMANSQVNNANEQQEYQAAANTLQQEQVTWDRLHDALKALRRFITNATNSGYANFNRAYMQGHDGRSWHDEGLEGLLAIFEYPNGVRTLRNLRAKHDPNTGDDYAEMIVEDLVNGKLVIVDQSMGDPELNRHAAERVMWELFNQQKSAFISPQQDDHGNVLPPPDALVYVEEAHNLLPAGSTIDTTNIWARTAKEGSKYRIGLVYATQEPSSIQSNIMKNTDNWFVAHLNNADEIRELRKYYDFEDFAQSILQVPDPGFLRMRTLSNPYIVPIQVNKFEV